MNTVAIVGVGLIGSSFGLALRQAGFEGEIIGVSSQPALAEAKALGAISSSASLHEAAHNADVIYLSQTVDRIIETLALLAGRIPNSVLVTDAGSTKALIVRKAAECLPSNCFLGGHPLAGKETRGPSAAESNLFSEKPYVLTPPQGPDTPHLQAFLTYLRRMGAILVEVEAEQHDKALAFTSHLPQLLSTALASTLQGQNDSSYRQLHGPGLLDMTRLAMSAPELWSAILNQNRENVLFALDSFLAQCAVLRSAVDRCEIQEIFHSGHQFSECLRREKTLKV
jgi:prephenate dehydrogenase